jgi:hypothetical protein
MSNFIEIEQFGSHEQKCLEEMGVSSKHSFKRIRSGDLFGYEFTNITNYPRRLIYDQSFKKKLNFLQEAKTPASPILLTPIDHEEEIFCVEGESDMIALSNYTSNILSFCGANSTSIEKYITDLKKHLTGRETFSILFDNDEAGIKGAEVLRSNLLKLFPESKVKILNLSAISPSFQDLRQALFLDKILTFNDILSFSSKTPHMTNDILLLSEVIGSPTPKLKLPNPYYIDDRSLGFSLMGKDTESVIFLKGDHKGIKSVSKLSKDQMKDTFELDDLTDLPTVTSIDEKQLHKLWPQTQNSKTLYNIIKDIFVSRIFNSIHEYHDIHTSYVFLSYIYPVFPRVPYLHIQGNKHCGKSQLSSVFESLCFNAEMSTSSTMAAIRRTLHHSRGTLILDDWERDSSSANSQELLSMLNSGYDTRVKSTIVNPDNLRPTKLYVGGPKVINSINKLDNVLASRCIIEKMAPAPTNFKISPLPTTIDILEIKNSLILWALENHQAVLSIFNSGSLPNCREDELYAPLLAINEFIHGKDSPEYLAILKVKKRHRELQSEKMSINEIILDEIYLLWSEHKHLYEFDVSFFKIQNSLKDRGDLPTSYHPNKISEALNSYNILLGTFRRTEGGIKPTYYKVNVPAMISAWEKLPKRDGNTSSNFN